MAERRFVRWTCTQCMRDHTREIRTPVQSGRDDRYLAHVIHGDTDDDFGPDHVARTSQSPDVLLVLAEPVDLSCQTADVEVPRSMLGGLIWLVKKEKDDG